MKVKRLSDGAVLDVSNKAYALVYSKCSDFEVYIGDSCEEQSQKEQTTQGQQQEEQLSNDKPQSRTKKNTTKPKDIASEDNAQKNEGDPGGDTAKSEDTP